MPRESIDVGSSGYVSRISRALFFQDLESEPLPFSIPDAGGYSSPRSASVLHRMNAFFSYFALLQVFLLGIRAKLTALWGNSQGLAFKGLRYVSRSSVVILHRVFSKSFRKSIPTHIRQLIIRISNSEG